jgi:hypothetical protein
MGTRTRATALKTEFEEHLISITATPVRPGRETDPGVQRTSATRKAK